MLLLFFTYEMKKREQCLVEIFVPAIEETNLWESTSWLDVK